MTVPVRSDPNCPLTPPYYPATARAYENEGVVGLLIYVEGDGVPRAIVVESSSGFLELDESALRSAREWRFLPARDKGATVGAWHRLRVRFRLED